MDITLNVEGDVAVITMDDGKKNVINPDALVNLNAAFDKAEADSKAVVFAGRPGSFCAGFEKDIILGSDKKKSLELSMAGARLMERLYDFPKPLIAACTGHAFTIGAIWMSACDRRIGEEGKYLIGLNETKLGVSLSDWAIAELRERLKPEFLYPAILAAELFAPEKAVIAGYLDEVVPAGQAIERACAVAAEYAALPGKAFALTKRMLRRRTLEIIRADLNATQQASGI